MTQRESERPTEAAGEDRRSFTVELAALVFGGLASVGPFLIGLFAFLDPLTRRKQPPAAHRDADGGTREGFLHIAALSSLAVGEAPRRFPVIADKQDAWNFSPDQPIGAVYVQRVDEQQVRVFNVTCPHAGCSVACDGAAFHCPCHNSSFNLDGSQRESVAGRENPSRRGLDELEVDPDQLAEGEIWVEFMNFYTGIAEKKAKL